MKEQEVRWTCNTVHRCEVSDRHACNMWTKTPEVPVYASTLEGETRPTWSSQADSLDNPTYDTETKIRSTPAPLASQTDLSQDSSTHYTALQLNERGRTNGGYSDSDSYLKSRGGHRSLDTDDEHEYQGLYTEVPSNPSFKDQSSPNTDSEMGLSPSSSLGESLRDSRGDSLQRGGKLSSTAEDTDSSEPYYIKLTRDDMNSDQSPCLDIPNLGIRTGSTSGDDTSDYEHLNFNREDILARQIHNIEDEDEGENGGYGIMVMEDRIGDANPPEAWAVEEEYDRLDRGPVGRGGTRPLG
ncbi:uncharacterized protein [Amphiura filiformis]|uniref:uncharacterized protein isoform X2 n=1 Tax=Amphiura filiformis TaxID=82378 RepID=UPI003B22031C